MSVKTIYEAIKKYENKKTTLDKEEWLLINRAKEIVYHNKTFEKVMKESENYPNMTVFIGKKSYIEPGTCIDWDAMHYLYFG